MSIIDNVVVCIILIMSRPITVVLHEFGYVISYLCLSNHEVSLYLGGYNNGDNSFKFQIGRLKVYFLYKTFLVKGMLCSVEKEITSPLKRSIFISSAPIVSFLIASSCIYFGIIYNIPSSLKIVLAVLFASSFYDFFISIIPDYKPVKLPNEEWAYSNSQITQDDIGAKFRKWEYDFIRESLDEGKDNKAAKYCEERIHKGTDDVNFYRFLLSIYTNIKEYDKAIELADDMERKFDSEWIDYGSVALAHSWLENHKKALLLYNKSIETQDDNIYSRVNRGYTYTLLEQYQEAIADFDFVLNQNDQDAYALSNRGLAKFKSGEVETGLEEMQKAISLDEQNSYCHKNLGIYYFDKGEYQIALDNFEKAKSLNSDTHLIDGHISEVKDKLEV